MGTGANKFHNLRVKLVNVPAGARVSHRMGYYDQSKATVELDRTLTAGEILTNSIRVDAVRVRAFTAAFPYRDGVAQAPVVLEIDGNSLVNGISGNNTLPAEIFVYAFDRQGVPRDFVYQRVGLELGKLRDKLEAKGVKFYHTLLLPPGDYSIRALVRTEKGRSGLRPCRCTYRHRPRRRSRRRCSTRATAGSWSKPPTAPPRRSTRSSPAKTSSSPRYSPRSWPASTTRSP